MKITFKRYRPRQQPLHRRHLGKFESKKEARDRLKKIKEEKEQLKLIKEEIENKNMNEYHFIMHSVKNNSGELIRSNIYYKGAMNETKRELLYLDFEINRVENKLMKIMPSCVMKKINLESGEVLETTVDNGEYDVYSEYLDKLKKSKNEVLKRIDKSREC
ncbi:U3 small nucleolar RNA-associated protein 11 [Dictyocoela muelleri]|nr:U3 small nucleolar RNA-associated protein 11 [Dictyocoela muelleri]